MDIELLRLYARLAEQREELIAELDKSADAEQRNMSSGVAVRHGGPVSSQRLRREILWKEQQIIALLGGVIRYELQG